MFSKIEIKRTANFRCRPLRWHDGTFITPAKRTANFRCRPLRWHDGTLVTPATTRLARGSGRGLKLAMILLQFMFFSNFASAESVGKTAVATSDSDKLIEKRSSRELLEAAQAKMADDAARLQRVGRQLSEKEQQRLKILRQGQNTLEKIVQDLDNSK